MENLYREHILDHYHHPRNQGTLEDADISCELDNPVCGDVVRLDVRLSDGRVSEVRFSGHGCVISIASASMLTEEILGKTVEELNAQWYDHDYWTSRLNSYREWDERIREFNERTGLLKEYE